MCNSAELFHTADKSKARILCVGKTRTFHAIDGSSPYVRRYTYRGILAEGCIRSWLYYDLIILKCHVTLVPGCG